MASSCVAEYHFGEKSDGGCFFYSIIALWPDLTRSFVVTFGGHLSLLNLADHILTFSGQICGFQDSWGPKTKYIGHFHIRLFVGPLTVSGINQSHWPSFPRAIFLWMWRYSLPGCHNPAVDGSAAISEKKAQGGCINPSPCTGEG